MNRRKFIGIIGFASIGILSKNQSKALEININRFNNNTQVNLNNVETIKLRINDITITSNNINRNKNAQLSISGTIDGKNIGLIETYNITINDDKINVEDQLNNSELLINLSNGEKFDKSYLSNDTYTDQSTININIIFELNHPSINTTIKETANYTLGLGSNNNGELVEQDFEKHGNKTSSSNQEILVFSGSNLNVLSESGFDQIKKLVSGGATSNKTSSTTFKSGGIDIDNIRFDNSSPRNHRNLKFNDKAEATNFSGSNLNVLSESGFDQIKKLVSGGATSNKTSSTTFKSGGIDIDNIRFDNSSPRKNYNIPNTEPSKSIYFIG